jgi:hypothetical protein
MMYVILCECFYARRRSANCCDTDYCYADSEYYTVWQYIKCQSLNVVIQNVIMMNDNQII